MNRKLINSFIILCVVVVAAVFVNRTHEKTHVFYGDAIGYYAYLPQAFIFHNLDGLDKFPEDEAIPPGVRTCLNDLKNGSVLTEKGYRLNQYTYGVALMEAPFFFAAHAYEKVNGLPAKGFSDNYKLAIQLSSLCYILLGLFITYRVLKNWFNSTMSLLTVALILSGTHLFWFTFFQAGMSHSVLFFLYALLIHCTILVHKQSKRWLFLLIGFIIGLIAVIRPSDIFAAAIPVCYGVYNKETFIQKWGWVRANFLWIALACLAAIIPAIPQLMLWKWLSGHYIFYSYGNQSFNWRHPRIWDGLFSFSNGWLPYAPVMIFALLGLLLYKYKAVKEWLLAIVVILPVYVYVIYSWYSWNYPNGMGSRPMIHLYPLLAIPLAAFLFFISKRPKVVGFLFVLISIFFVSVIFSFSILKSEWKLNSDETNMQYAMQTLYRTDINYNDLVVADLNERQPDTTRLQLVARLGREDFSDSLSVHYEPEIETGAKYVYHMQDGEEYLPIAIKLKYTKQVFKNAKWFKCSGRFRFHTWPNYSKRILTLAVNRGNKLIKWCGMKADNKIGLVPPYCIHKLGEYDFNHYENNRWGTLYFYTKIPHDIQEGDDIELTVWNATKNDMFLDWMELEIYK